MKRRTFVRGSAGLTAGLGIAGCLGFGGNNSPPPRRAEVFEDVSLNGREMQISLMSNPRVETRAENVQGDIAAGGVVTALLPVGVARAAKGAGSRGAGGYSNAPSHWRHRSWAVWHGGAYTDDWRDDHDDEIDEVQASVATLGVAYIGSDNDYENNTPGPGPVDWDRTWDDPSGGAEITADIGALSPGSGPREGWYRIGTQFESSNGTIEPEWQAVDFEVDNDASWRVDKAWYVAPRV